MENLIGDMARSIGLPALKQAAGLVTRVVPIPQPLLMLGPGSSARLGQAIGAFGHRKLLLVSDAVVTRLGLMAPLTDALRASGTPFVLFDGITPDTPIDAVEKGIALFNSAHCDAILAFGGGSVMDAAKVIGLAAANAKHPRDLVGYFKGLHGPVPLYAVPTTAGTGSEVTVAAVVSDPEHGQKLVIADTRIVPDMAALDPCLMTGLPADITAATGMDALTHAVEAYLGGWSTPYTDRMALAAVGMVYQHLPVACRDGANLQAREHMALAACYAGLAFTRANVGNVHAIAHQLGGHYHTPHGLANAILLPGVLRFCAQASRARLAELALRAFVATKDQDEDLRARRFIESVDAMNTALGIPRHLDALRARDIPALARAACWEADANYPVPRRMAQADCEALLRDILPPAGSRKRTPRTPAPQASRAARAPRAQRASASRKTPRRRPDA